MLIVSSPSLPMIAMIEAGDCDNVATRRVNRKGEPPIRSFFAKCFYKVMRHLSHIEIADGARDYRLMSRAMVDSIVSVSEYNRFSKGIFAWVGYETKWLEFENVERSAGETKWSFWKLVRGEEGYSTLERTGIRPCLDVNGIWGGYIGEGAKTVLPSEAHAKISMRLVPNQDSETISRLFAEHFKSIAPACVKVEVKPCHGGNGFLIPISSPAYKAASRAMTEVYGIEPVPSRGGGSIPVLADLQRILGIDPLLMGFGLERDTIHSPNESYLLKQFFAGMESIALFYKYL